MSQFVITSSYMYLYVLSTGMDLKSYYRYQYIPIGTVSPVLQDDIWLSGARNGRFAWS